MGYKTSLVSPFDEANEDGSINLHARRLEFIHPVKKEPLIVIASLPENYHWKLFKDFQSKEN